MSPIVTLPSHPWNRLTCVWRLCLFPPCLIRLAVHALSDTAVSTAGQGLNTSRGSDYPAQEYSGGEKVLLELSFLGLIN